MSLREAAEKALRVLSQVESNEYCELDSAINALRTALAEEEEPVAWYHPSGEGYDSAFRDHSTVMACDGGDWSEWIPLYTHPPRREPLTEKVVLRLYREAWTPDTEANEVLDFARAIERAHGIGTDE